MFLQVFRGFYIVLTGFTGFTGCTRHDGDRSEPRWRAKREPLASEASPVWLAVPTSLSVELAWDAPKILKVCLTCPQALFRSSLSSLKRFH